jgi:membrane associated rhomboid family serine protease
VRPPESWKSARVTLVIAAVTAAAWLLAGTGLQHVAVAWGAFIPANVGPPFAPDLLTPLTATLLHANWIHLGFNLLMLLFCGRAVETILGARGLIILYILGAYAAAAAQWAADPSSMVPMIGASGAISAVLGAYAMLFARNKVKVASPSLALWLHALWLAAAWVGLQLLIGFTFRTAGPAIAIAAHIGGFLIGLVLAKPLLLLRYRGA